MVASVCIFLGTADKWKRRKTSPPLLFQVEKTGGEQAAGTRGLLGVWVS